jgi:hypothetical protein
MSNGVFHVHAGLQKLQMWYECAPMFMAKTPSATSLLDHRVLLLDGAEKKVAAR